MVVNNRAVAALASLQFFFLLASVIVRGLTTLIFTQVEIKLSSSSCLAISEGGVGVFGSVDLPVFGLVYRFSEAQWSCG